MLSTTRLSAHVSAPPWIALAVLALSACFGTTRRVVPSVNPALESTGLIGEEVVLLGETGAVGMKLDSLRYPYIMGNAISYGGMAQVRIDRYDGYSVVALDESGRITSRRRLRSPDVLREPGILIGNNIQFTSSSGSVVLRDVELVDPPWAEGRLVSGNGPIRADLRAGRTLEVSETNWSKSVLYTALGIAAAALLLLLIFYSEDFGPP